MRVDALALVLRPRSMFEAADLGAALLHAHARSVWHCFLPFYGGVLLLVLPTAYFATWLPPLLLFMLKPWLDRTLLFVLARAAFGQASCWADVWQARSALWFKQWFATLFSRLSPRRAYLLPALQLEGQFGRSLRARRRQLLRHRSGAAVGLHFVFSHVEMALYFSLLSLGIWFASEGSRENVLTWIFSDDAEWLSQLVTTLAYALVVGLLEPFYVAAGFCMYLNRRVELEAWDVEQALRAAFATPLAADQTTRSVG